MVFSDIFLRKEVGFEENRPGGKEIIYRSVGEVCAAMAL
jgi:hypothetical protein